ncbi:RagB/SusD family nutrient uptake outer membrane protein [Polaribacter sp. SA4-12]|uniref:RagB/SusD family nutrient uptake outer membrane protein n=1 Tax=Polaribacter sp. SA4-12 TaxID=1312072 RepID=UPI000B3CB932|nr:RagB/SusD family nutrient uptake outer membrane protein [Polaribacter sp. SA4-12]ARV16606.1 RagB/SusD family nutrient uptake outer membrane protein [Polaribacter sp. SA4-12]
MKKIFNYKFTMLLIIILSMSACNEDFLEEANPNEISTDSYWKTLGDLESGLVAVYNAFKDGNTFAIVDETKRSDLAWPGYGRPTTSDVYYLQTFNDASGTANGKWKQLYKGIFRANQVIVATDNLMPTFNATQKAEAGFVKAQARFLRGLFYFYLYNGFNEGNVPLVTEVPENEADFYQPISPAADVKAFYLADLEYAESNLPIEWKENRDLGRITAGAATAVLGKSYLYEADYATAATYFTKVATQYNYSLAPNIGSNFTTMDEFNQESILEVSYSLAYKPEINPYSSQQTSSTMNFMMSPVGGWRVIYPANWLVMEYKNEIPDTTDPRNTITEEDGVTTRPRKYSLRTSYSIALADDRDLPYYGAEAAQKAPFNNLETAYWRKYTNWDIAEDEKDISSSFPRSGVNIRLIRLADVYLMLAECLIEGGINDGGVEQATRLVNLVRRRSAVQLLGADGTGDFPLNDHNNITYDANSLMAHIMHVERPLELSAEGNAIRALDLRRWGKTKERFTELSLRRYSVEDYKFTNLDGTSGTRWGGLLVEDPLITPNVNLNEFVQPAQNYIESEHAYWPIPNSETIANPNL